MADIIPVLVPKWGLAMTEGTVTNWQKAEGDPVAKGDELVDVESSKIANVVEAQGNGILRKIVAAEGDTIPVGGLLAVIALDSVSDAEVAAFVQEFEDNFDADAALAAEAGPEPETIEAGGMRLRFLKMGEGEATPLLLLHGYGGDLNNFLFNQSDLAEDRPVYTLDLPGHGGSTKDVGDGSVSVLVNAVEAFLDSQGLAKVHLGGHSMGGGVALAFALAHPDHVASVVTICGAGYGTDVNMAYIEGFQSAKRRRDMTPIAEMLFADKSLVTRDMLEDLIAFKRLDGVTEALTALARGAIKEFSGAGLSDRLGALKVPVLGIWGAADEVIPLPDTDSLGLRKVVMLPNVGHMAHMEAAASVTEAIRDYIANPEQFD